MPNSLNECCVRCCAEFRNQGFARFAICGVDPYLDQLVVIQCQQNFVCDRRCDAAVTNDHDRLAVMSQGFEMTFLWVGESLHAGNRTW